jgi:hypothetical protein
MSTNQVPNPQNPAAETPQPVTMLPPEQVVDRLRTLRSQIPAIAHLTARQRKLVRDRIRISDAVIQSSINVIGASDGVAQAVGHPAEDVRQMVDDGVRWSAVEDELKATLNGVAGGNLVRRQRLALFALQAYIIGLQLARDPANAGLVPHVQEVRRLRRIARRRKAKTAAPAAEGPTPSAPLQ